uniref:Uncharacterized protein ycf23 n=1 Tax=Wildemania schizophylla TaxID=1134705 RepID=A0A126G321_WILSC|nr:hypothetical chloroplast RF23 [Wildemania schizophylla]AKS28518.1 hypothetical chloroplast RF23 [Wildemania schizophylla]
MTIFSRIASDFSNQKAIKIITGLNNFNIKQIKQIAQASEIARATYIDIAADIEIVKEIQDKSMIPICVSAVSVKELVKCQQANVQILEIGNYDCFYEQGRVFSFQEIIGISREAKNLMPEATLCATVPHVLTMGEQIELAHELASIGINLIQTEGKSTGFTKKADLSGVIEKSAATLSSTYSISHNTTIPIISASGISALTSPISFIYGASCVGLGTNIRRLQNTASMVIYIYEIQTAIKCNRNIKQYISHSIKSSQVTHQLVVS